MMQDTELIRWLMGSDEAMTRYRTRVDLLDQPPHEEQAQNMRLQIMEDERVQRLISLAGQFPDPVLKRHNDAGHSIPALTVLADFGLNQQDEGVSAAVQAVVGHANQEGILQCLMQVSKHFGGTGEPQLTWQLCDLPSLVYAVLGLGKTMQDSSVAQSMQHLLDLNEDCGWRCLGDPALNLRGPGRKTDPCPIATLLSLKAISMVPDLLAHPAADQGIEMLLKHWNRDYERKLYLFGSGTHFHVIKYPYVWYDLLHVLEILSRFPQAREDERYQQMLAKLDEFTDPQGRVTATSMYTTWKDWSFADKKNPSPWLSFLVARIRKRSGVVWAL